MEAETAVAEETTPARGSRQRDGAAPHNSVVLGPRDSLIGKLTVDGDVRVQGTVEGELHASGDVQIEGGGNVKASIQARNVTVRGTVSGDVTAKKRLTLAGPGALMGNVNVTRLSIEDGASLNGNVTMATAGEHRGEHRTEENGNKEGG